MDTRFPEQQYTLEEVLNAALIFHPKAKKYNIKSEEISHIFEEGSNFTLLETPIIDEWGNEFRDSEGYYMAQRTAHAEEKKMIAFLSTGRGLSTKAREFFSLEQDEEKRISFMRKTIQQKFDRNPKFKALLMQT
ncbi:MAG: hypothetical protein LBG52_08030 [Candidatus Peribacteria bacterium]|jgi:predicted NAD-dependent protein-ADP-ribosyltransferase YbiA (DUF1768 family)|nr:hypothetical protein [Candidatus Peribacteria bacterium]